MKNRIPTNTSRFGSSDQWTGSPNYQPGFVEWGDQILYKLSLETFNGLDRAFALKILKNPAYQAWPNQFKIWALTIQARSTNTVVVEVQFLTQPTRIGPTSFVFCLILFTFGLGHISKQINHMGGLELLQSSYQTHSIPTHCTSTNQPHRTRPFNSGLKPTRLFRCLILVDISNSINK